MSSELTLLRDYKKDKPPVRWCVYYNDNTGEVETVTNREKNFLKLPHITTDSDDARQILMGLVDPKKYSVVEVAHEFKLVEKTSVLRIKQAERRLSVVPLNNKQKADVNIIMYINSWKMEVNFNQDTLYRMTGQRFFRNVSLNPEDGGEYDPIILYLIKDNDPNFLVKTLEVDPAELIEQGYIIFDMSPLRRICGLGEIKILTKKIFSSYRMQRRGAFTALDYRSRFAKRRAFALPTAQRTHVPTDFTIIRNKDETFLKSNFNNPEDNKIYGDLVLYITDKSNPSLLVQQLTIPKDNIGWEQTCRVNISNINLTKCGF